MMPKIICMILFSVLIFSVALTQSFGYGGGGGGGKEPDPRVCGDRLCSEIPGGRDAWENKETIPITIKTQPLITSLKTQMKKGISPNFLTCTDGFELIFKLRDNSPACVTPKTAEKLIQRGWAIKEESPEVNQIEQNIQNQIIQTIPASSRTVVNFYVNDSDLNTNPNGIDIVSTSGLIEITINGVMIDAPKKMIETSPNSGKFFLEIELPETINGKTFRSK